MNLKAIRVATVIVVGGVPSMVGAVKWLDQRTEEKSQVVAERVLHPVAQQINAQFNEVIRNQAVQSEQISTLKEDNAALKRAVFRAIREREEDRAEAR